VLSSPRACWLWTTFAILLVGLLGVCLAPGLLGSDDSLERLRRQGVLRVGYAVAPPLATLTGDLVPHGEAVDNIPGIARALGIPRVEWVQAAYDTLISDLLERRFDVVASQLGMSPERQAQVSFSKPVIELQYGVLVARGNPHHFVGYDRLLPRPGQVIAVTRRSVAEAELRRRGYTDAQLLLVAANEGSEALLRVGAAQALVRTAPVLELLARTHPDEFELLPRTEGSNTPDMVMGYVFHPRDKALRKAWDGVLGAQSIPASPR
jgi:polar amino acid transport system substrate-binding protein